MVNIQFVVLVKSDYVINISSFGNIFVKMIFLVLVFSFYNTVSLFVVLNFSTMEDVFKFLSDHNRPFTVNDIIQGLEKKMSKSKVLSILIELVSENRVIEKNCGKQKIYCIAQNSSLPLKDVSNQVFELERQNTSLALQLKDVEKEFQKHSAQLKEFENVLIKKEVIEKKQILEEEVVKLQTELDSYGGITIDLEKKKTIERNYTDIAKEYLKRKRLCTDMVDAIYENYPKTKKHLLQEIGIETDEDANFQFKKLF